MQLQNSTFLNAHGARNMGDTVLIQSKFKNCGQNDAKQTILYNSRYEEHGSTAGAFGGHNSVLVNHSTNPPPAGTGNNALHGHDDDRKTAICDDRWTEMLSILGHPDDGATAPPPGHWP